jgi:hypothetical protein
VACILRDYKSAATPNWHIQLIDGGATIANLSITVQSTAVPEFPTVISGIVVIGLCLGIYAGMNRRKRLPVN